MIIQVGQIWNFDNIHYKILEVNYEEDHVKWIVESNNYTQKESLSNFKQDIKHDEAILLSEELILFL